MIIYLIGMTGVGKSTLGKRLATRLGYYFIDLDAYIEMRAQKRIPELFEGGEAHFRRCESEALEAIESLESQGAPGFPNRRNYVVATGGGIITVPENIERMGKNGFVVLLERPISEIKLGFNTEKRPLFKNQPHKLDELYKERYRTYVQACHIRVNCSHMSGAIRRIIEEVRQYENSRT